MLILEIRFSVITYDPICICWWSRLWVGRIDFSMQDIIQPLEQTISKVHIANWIYVFEMDTSWELSVWVCPFMFNSFHVVLIDNDNNSFSFTLINLFEKVLISFINENSLEFWEVDITSLDIPVHLVWIQTLFWKLGCWWVYHSWLDFPPFEIPELISMVLKSFK